jgi:hypothetical protein
MTRNLDLLKVDVDLIATVNRLRRRICTGEPAW